MADTPDIPKKTRSAKPKSGASKTRSRTQPPPNLDGDGDGDLRSQIARRAYEISLSESAGSEEENWLRAEREVSGQAR